MESDVSKLSKIDLLIKTYGYIIRVLIVASFIETQNQALCDTKKYGVIWNYWNLESNDD